MEFFFPLPKVPLEDRERYYGVWAKWFGKEVPPPHERIFRVRFTYKGQEMLAEIGKPVAPGQPPIVAIFGGDPLVVCSLDEGAFAVPFHRVIEAEFFDDPSLPDNA
jgi:hypothetical protein